MPADPTYEPGKPGSRSRAAQKRKPKPRPKPKAEPKTRARSAMPGDPGFGTGPDVRARSESGSTSARVSVDRKTGRASVPRSQAQDRDPEYESLLAEVEDYERTKNERGPKPKTQTAGIDRLRALGLTGGGTSGLGDVLANLGGDALDVVTGVPSAVVLASKTTAYPFMKLAGQEGAEQVESDIATAGRAVAEDYGYRWGPLFRGDLGTFGERVKEHPGLFALDVAGGYSAAGSGVRLGARAGGAVTGSERLARTGSMAITPESARYRSPKVLEMEMGENTAQGLKGRSVARIEVPQRPYSSNPITRGVQRSTQDRLQAIGDRMARSADEGSRLTAYFGTGRRFNRAIGRAARDFRLQADQEAGKALRIQTAEYREAVHALDDSGIADRLRGRGWSKEQVDAALFLHGRDLLDVPGLTPIQARDRVVAFMREGLDAAVTGGGKRSKGAQRTIEAIASVPDELLDLRAGAPALRAAVDEYRALSNLATEGRVRAGAISAQTAEATGRRSAQMVHEGLVFDHKSGEWLGANNPYSTVGQRGVYTPDLPVDPLKTGRAGDASGAFGRMTQDKVKQSHGTLFGRGNVAIDRGLPIKALERALVDRAHPSFVKDFYETFAFRRPNGQLSQGKRAALAMEADPENVVLMSRKSLDDAMRLAKDLPEGQMPESPLANVRTIEGKDWRGSFDELSPAQRKELVAFPKAAVNGMRQGWDQTAGGRLPVFDTGQQLWKRGILAFAPRWYLNSLFGNTLMYGMLTGGDLRSLMQARRSKLGEAVPERASGSTNVAEARMSDPRKGTAAGDRYRAITDRLMNAQGSFDALFKRAAYINRAKKGLRDEGVKTRRMSPEDLDEALRNAPQEVKDQALREAELFLGDYLRLSPMERATLRRVFPFYSWMRVIGRLMFNLPVRYPKRTAVTALVSQASAEAINPEDITQPIYNRGRINIGDFSMRTSGANPLFTHSEIIKSAAGGDPKSLVGALASQSSPIGIQQGLRLYSGTTFTGAPVSFPPGYGGSAAQFGRSTMRIDPVTGIPDYFEPSIPMSEQILQTVPLVPQLVRGIASGGRQPYDVTTTLDLLSRSKPDSELFRPEYDRAMEPIPTIGPLLGWAGLNFQRRDRNQEAADFRRRLRDFEEAQRQTERRKRRAR